MVILCKGENSKHIDVESLTLHELSLRLARYPPRTVFHTVTRIGGKTVQFSAHLNAGECDT